MKKLAISVFVVGVFALGIMRFAYAQSVTFPTVTTNFPGSGFFGGGIMSDGGSAIIESGVEYGLTTSYGQKITSIVINPNATNYFSTDPSTTSGLACGTTYHFRAYAKNWYGTGYGADLSTITPSCPPSATVVTTGRADGPFKNSSFWHASFTGVDAIDTGFEYGPTTAYGSKISSGPGSYGAGPGGGMDSFAMGANSLLCGTQYHYRAYVKTSAGIFYGQDLPYKTTPCSIELPIVKTISAEALNDTAVSLTGNLVSDGGEQAGGTTLNFSLSIGSKSVSVGGAYPAPNAYITGPFTEHILGLTCGVTYTYRATAKSTRGIAKGAPLTFKLPCTGTKIAPILSWKNRITTSNQIWKSVVSTGDGTKLFAVHAEDANHLNSHVYTSVNGGVTWKKQNGSANYSWNSIATSIDGKKLVALGTPDAFSISVYTSSDGAVTWTKQKDIGNALSITSSSDGTKLALIDPYHGVYTSGDSGLTWVLHTVPGEKSLTSLAMSADGTKLILATDGGLDKESYLYQSIDSGVTWNKLTSAGMHAWNAVASSADGTKLVASTAIDYKPVAGNEVTFDGNQPYIYTSTDAGATWKKQPGAPSMNHLSISADGMRVLGSGSATYLSLDGGVNWTKQNSDPSFVAVSGNGKKFVVAKFHTIATAETIK